MMMNVEKVGAIIGAVIGRMLGSLALIVVLSALFALPVQWLWNALCPDLFGLPTVGFLQAWGLNILSGCLFGKTTTVKSAS
jgi:hypothetical protein